MLKLKNNKLKKKYIIKVPKNIQVIYSNNENILIFFKSSQIKFVNLKVKIALIPTKNLIIVTDISSICGLKKTKKLQGTTVAIIKQQLVEISHVLFMKLNLVGVGYRVFLCEKISNQVYLKLGYSHLIYFNIPTNLTVFCYKSTKLFLYGLGFYNKLTQTASQIRACKVPEVYKGKGILYDQEKVILKKGKKV